MAKQGEEAPEHGSNRDSRASSFQEVSSAAWPMLQENPGHSRKRAWHKRAQAAARNTQSLQQSQEQPVAIDTTINTRRATR